MIDAHTLTTIRTAERWISVPDALRGAARYQSIADELRRNARTERRSHERGGARRAAHLSAKADTCQAIADELRDAARKAEAQTIDGRLAG